MHAATVVLICAAAASAVGLAYTKHQSRALFVALEERRAERDELEIAWRRLQSELATLAAAARVDRAARERLGMVVPAPDAVVYVRR